ncbi:MAG: flavin reductase family protein [Candidatus Aenigmarchaeota archaeon]|nr:flavin reductase family protein [Candidatus Aenigmarchaeota archaeon]
MRISEQIFPRAVALLGTCGKDGRPNLMSVSFIMPISFDPKYVAFSIAPHRFSYYNLQQVEEFTLNFLDTRQKELAAICGAYSGRDKDKFQMCGLDPIRSRKVFPPVVYCPVSYECQVMDMKELGDHVLVVGAVLEEWVRRKDFTPLLHKGGSEYMSPVGLK